MKKDLATLYDHLFTSLELLKDSSYTSLEGNIKRAAAVRQVAQTVIEAAKLEVAVHKLKKESNLDGLFPNLDLPGKQLGAGDEEAGNRDQGSGGRENAAGKTK